MLNVRFKYVQVLSFHVCYPHPIQFNTLARLSYRNLKIQYDDNVANRNYFIHRIKMKHAIILNVSIA